MNEALYPFWKKKIVTAAAGGRGNRSWITQYNLVSEAISDTEISLFWQDGQEVVDEVRIYVSTDNILFTLLDTVAHGVGVYSATGLAQFTLYYFRVTPVKSGKEGDSLLSSSRTYFAGVIGEKTPYLYFDNFKELDLSCIDFNNQIYRWHNADRSKYLTNSTTAKRPYLAFDSSLPVIRFTRDIDSALFVAFGETLSGVTIFVKYKIRSIASGSAMAIVDGIASGSRNLVVVDTAGKYGIYAGTSLASNVIADTNGHYLTAIFGATDILRIDGETVISGNAGAHTLTGITLANDYNGGTAIDIDIQKVLIYNSVLAPEEYSVVESYLAVDEAAVFKNYYENTPSQLSSEAYWFNEGTMGYFTRGYFYNNKYYFAWVLRGGGDHDLTSKIFSLSSDGNIAPSKTLIQGDVDGLDGHSLSSVIIDDNGYVYGVRATTDTSEAVGIVKSDSPEDITSFTQIQVLENGVDGVSLDVHQYPAFSKSGTDIYLFMRSSETDNPNETYWVYKKGLTDDVFSNGNPFIQVGVANSKIYKIILRSKDENKLGFAFMSRDITGTTGCYTRLGYIESSDGINWTNAGGTFSKDIASDGFITLAQSDENCIIEKASEVDSSHYFCHDGLFVNGVPYLLVQEGTAFIPLEQHRIDVTSINVRYYNNGEWVKKEIPSFITGVPYDRYYSEAQRFHLIHDGTKFVLFVLSIDSKSIKKYTTADFNTWLYIETILSESSYYFGLLGTATNENDVIFITKHDPETVPVTTLATYAAIVTHKVI